MGHCPPTGFPCITGITSPRLCRHAPFVKPARSHQPTGAGLCSNQITVLNYLPVLPSGLLVLNTATASQIPCALLRAGWPFLHLVSQMNTFPFGSSIQVLIEAPEGCDALTTPMASSHGLCTNTPFPPFSVNGVSVPSAQQGHVTPASWGLVASGPHTVTSPLASGEPCTRCSCDPWWAGRPAVLLQGTGRNLLCQHQHPQAGAGQHVGRISSPPGHRQQGGRSPPTLPPPKHHCDPRALTPHPTGQGGCRGTLICFPSLWICLFCTLPVNGITQQMAF